MHFILLDFKTKQHSSHLLCSLIIICKILFLPLKKVLILKLKLQVGGVQIQLLSVFLPSFQTHAENCQTIAHELSYHNYSIMVILNQLSCFH